MKTAWGNDLGQYSIRCDLDTSKEAAEMVVVENGQELHRESLTRAGQEDGIEFNARVWERVWELQTAYRPREMAGLRKEWARQAAEG